MRRTEKYPRHTIDGSWVNRAEARKLRRNFGSQCRLFVTTGGSGDRKRCRSGKSLIDTKKLLARDVLQIQNSMALPRLFLAERKAVRRMLSRCANAQCSKPFLKLREGKLFLVETERLTKPGESAVPPFVRARQQQRCVEHYWLCDDCATHWTLVYDRKRGFALAALHCPAASILGAAATARSGAA